MYVQGFNLMIIRKKLHCLYVRKSTAIVQKKGYRTFFNVRYSKKYFWLLVTKQQGVKMVDPSKSPHRTPEKHNQGEFHCEIILHIKTNCHLSHLPIFFLISLIFFMLRLSSHFVAHFVISSTWFGYGGAGIFSSGSQEKPKWRWVTSYFLISLKKTNFSRTFHFRWKIPKISPKFCLSKLFFESSEF